MTLEEYIAEVKKDFMDDYGDEKYFNRPEVQGMIKRSFADGIASSGCSWSLYMLYPILPKTYC